MSKSKINLKKTLNKRTLKHTEKPYILLISNMYPSKKQQFSSSFIKNTVDLLRENKIKVYLAVKTGNSNHIFIKFFQYIKFFCVSILKGLFLKYNIIYVHYIAHSAIPVLFIKFFRTKMTIISHTHGGDILEEPQFFKSITNKTLNLSNLIITPSSYFKNIIINKYDIKAQKIKISPSGGVNTDLFKPKKVNRKEILKNYKNQIVLGFISRIIKGKGWNIFIEAIKELNHKNKQTFLGIIIGEGEEVNSMKQLIQELQLTDRIVYLGPKKHEELPFFYNCLDLFIFPTERAAESLGLVGLEAMSCGIPVIGSHIAGLKTYIKNGINGYTFSCGSIEELCEKIFKYLSLYKKEKTKMKEAARETALEYDRIKVSLDLAKTFEQL